MSISHQAKGEIADSHRFRATITVLAEYIKPDSAILEIGATDATFSSHFQYQQWQTVDKFGNPDVQADLNSPGLRLPLNEDSFDVVICTEVLEHLSAGASLVSEIARVLKPNGIAVVTVPNMVSLLNRVKWLLGRIPFMAASGDCGNDLGGTGILVDGYWVAEQKL